MKTEPENDPCPRNNTDTSPVHTTRANREEGHWGPCCKGRFFLQGWCWGSRNTYLPVKWLAILAIGLGGRAGGCLRRDNCFTGVSSWSPGKAADFLGGSSRTGLAVGSWDRRTPDSLDVGLSSDTGGHNHIIDATTLRAKQQRIQPQSDKTSSAAMRVKNNQ